MKKLVVTTCNMIQVGSKRYQVIEVDTSTLSKQIKDKSGVDIGNVQGVYIFVSNKDIPKFNLNFFNKEVTGVFFINNYPSIKIMEVPPFNNEPPQKECIFYVGRANKLTDRLKQHWNHRKINGCKSLKLGFLSRKWIKPFLRAYVIYTEGLGIDNKTLETEIRDEYGASFGK